MERKHIAEEIHFSLKELFEICEEVIYKESKYREDESSRGVLRLAKALIMYTSYADGNHFDERLYDFEKRKVMKQYTELTGVPKYTDRDVRPNSFKSDELIIKKEHYENLKQKASFFDRAWEIKDTLREIKDSLMQKINESSIVQGLRKTIKDLRKKVAALTKENESLKKEKEEHEIYLTFSQQQQVRYWIQQGKKNHEEALERMQREDERDFHHQPQRNQQRDRDEEERTIIDDWEER